MRSLGVLVVTVANYGDRRHGDISHASLEGKRHGTDLRLRGHQPSTVARHWPMDHGVLLWKIEPVDQAHGISTLHAAAAQAA